MSNSLNDTLRKHLAEGTVIPAHPLALNKDLSIDFQRQKLLTRYYMESGAGGVAVAVHTTQFEIRQPEFNLLEDVLQTASREIDHANLQRPFLKIAGVCGPVEQAVAEAKLAVKHGYHLGLLSMGGLATLSEEELINRAKAVSEIIPLFGFYLQPAVGGRYLSYSFWKKFAAIESVYAIKVAAFNRYHTLDVVRAVCESPRSSEIALYTGNDDNIVSDLITPYRFTIDGKQVEKRFVGGLLGHWAVWTSKTVQLFREIKACIKNNYNGVETLLARNIEVTDMNAVIFDAENSFKGSIAGIHEVLRRQGLMNNLYCLSPKEKLSPQQTNEIDRVYKMYLHLTDDDFVKEFLKKNV